MYTEAEAKTKQCCGPMTCGIWVNGGRERLCATTGCMAWRWRRKSALDHRNRIICEDTQATEEPDPRPDGVPENWIWHPFNNGNGHVARWTEPEPEPRGFCGLAGKE